MANKNNNNNSYPIVAYYVILLSMLKFVSSSNDTPVVLVHGYHSSPGEWDTFKNNFIRHNFTNVHVFDYSNTTEEHIANNSLLLYNYIVDNDIINKEPILIGHSMGGLVIRHMVSERGVNYGKIITLATPNYGAKLAKFCLTTKLPLCTDAVKDMKPSSDFLEELNNKTIETYTDTKLLTYYVDHDEQVYPESAIIKTGLYLAVNEYADFITISNENSTSASTSSMRNESNSNNTTGPSCEDFPDDITCTNETNFEPFGLGTVHSSIKQMDEVFHNVLNFIDGRVKKIEGGPKLRDGDCTILVTRSTVSWDLPENVSPNMKMNVLCEEKHHFDNGLASSQIRESLAKGTYKFRFFDPETTTISEWSQVQFYTEDMSCKTTISNNEKTISKWS